MNVSEVQQISLNETSDDDDNDAEEYCKYTLH